MAANPAQPSPHSAARRPTDVLPLGPFGRGLTERCVEVPWAASWLEGRSNILDIGFALSDIGWLRTLLSHVNAGTKVAAVDIIAPARVASRYPDDLRDQALAVPIFPGDVRSVSLPEAAFDTITCISTIEHIGFDAAGSGSESAFARWHSLEATPTSRDCSVTADVMAAFCSALMVGGLAIISVPMGRGGAVPVRDSLGFFTRQLEYNSATWSEITGAAGFRLVEQRFFAWLGDGGAGWEEVFSADALADRTAWLTPHAVGVALAVMERI